MAIQPLQSEIDLGGLMGTAALVLAPDGAVLIDTGVSSWTLEVFDVTISSAAGRRRSVYSVTVTPATTNTNASLPSAPLIWNATTTPRNDGYWQDNPEPGYNFLYFLSESARVGATPPFDIEGGHRYRLVFKFSTVSVGIVTLEHNIFVRPS